MTNPPNEQFLARLSESSEIDTFFDDLENAPPPTLLAVPAAARAFRVRLDLDGAEPPVWRTLELPGDLPLDRLHDVIQAAMGWENSHLHRFRTGRDYSAPHFVTHLDVEEAEVGLLEDGVRVDQVLAEMGDELWYEYDFGDNWEHRLVVEEVQDSAVPTGAPSVTCLAGGMACPPEDCGGLGGYDALAAWVRSDFDEALLPDGFSSVADGRGWIPEGWHPDHFDLDATDAAIAAAVAVPVEVTGELAELARRIAWQGSRQLREVLGRPESHAPTEVSDEDAARITEVYRIFLECLGDGVKLTAAGYLPPVLVHEFAQLSGIRDWWRRPTRREDSVPTVAWVRDTARALGLVRLHKGRLSPTVAAKRVGQDPQALLRHIADRLPVGTDAFDRAAGWLSLAVAGSGSPEAAWSKDVSVLLYLAGWESGTERFTPPSAHNPTLVVLSLLNGEARRGWRQAADVDPALAAAARRAIPRA